MHCWTFANLGESHQTDQALSGKRCTPLEHFRKLQWSLVSTSSGFPNQGLPALRWGIILRSVLRRRVEAQQTRVGLLELGCCRWNGDLQVNFAPLENLWEALGARVPSSTAMSQTHFCEIKTPCPASVEGGFRFPEPRPVHACGGTLRTAEMLALQPSCRKKILKFARATGMAYMAYWSLCSLTHPRALENCCMNVKSETKS